MNRNLCPIISAIATYQSMLLSWDRAADNVVVYLTRLTYNNAPTPYSY